MDDDKPREDQATPVEPRSTEKNEHDVSRQEINSESGQGDSTPTPLPDPVVNSATPAAHTSAGVIVLQWLTYAFWGWTLLAVIWLVYIVFAHFIMGTDQTVVIPYAIAATVVLLPLSFVCDLFYSRHENAKKTGAATVVMVIHAVIFALFGIGVLISAVFLLVGMIVNDQFGQKMPLTILVTLLVSAVLYGFTFLRTLNPRFVFHAGKPYRFAMLVLVGIFVVLAFAGPVAKSFSTRDDRALVEQLPSISESIESYVSSNEKLPAKLSDVELKPDAKKLVNKGLVEYKPEGRKAADYSFNNSSSFDADSQPAMTYEYRYQLCATYTASNKTDDSLSYEDQSTATEYSTYLSVYSHPSGKVCYKLMATLDSQVVDSGGSVNSLNQS